MPTPVRPEPHLPRWLPARGHHTSPSPEQGSSDRDPLTPDCGSMAGRSLSAGLSPTLQRHPSLSPPGSDLHRPLAWMLRSPSSSRLLCSNSQVSVMQSRTCYPVLASALQGPDTGHSLPAQHCSACFTCPRRSRLLTTTPRHQQGTGTEQSRDQPRSQRRGWRETRRPAPEPLLSSPELLTWAREITNTKKEVACFSSKGHASVRGHIRPKGVTSLTGCRL